jgi:hypothetical protein
MCVMIIFSEDGTTMWKCIITTKMLRTEVYKIIPEFRVWGLVRIERKRLETVLLHWIQRDEYKSDYPWLEMELRDVRRKLCGE